MSLPVCPNPACAELAAYDAVYCLECGAKLTLDLRPLTRYECLVLELKSSSAHGTQGEPAAACDARRTKHADDSLDAALLGEAAQTARERGA